jgi:hypothetical protein
MFLSACKFCLMTNNCLHDHILFYHTCFTLYDGLMAVRAHVPMFMFTTSWKSYIILKLYLLHKRDYHITMLEKCAVANILLTVADLIFLQCMEAIQHQHLWEHSLISALQLSYVA